MHLHSEFEYLYFKLRYLLFTSQCLLLKRKLVSLHSRFRNNFQFNEYCHPSALTQEHKTARTNLQNDFNIIISKPDKVPVQVFLSSKFLVLFELEC